MRASVRGWLVEYTDRLTASDPGHSRIRMALSGVIGMGTALAVEFLLGVVTHAQPSGLIVSMMLGAVVAMMGTMALSGLTAGTAALTALFFPVAVGVGLTAGVLVGGHGTLDLIVFVAIMFVAVFIRRFGRSYFFYGFMMWMGYFFATLLHATAPLLPGLLIAVSVAAAWVLVLSLTVLRTNKNRALRATIRAYDARARALAREIADLLETSPGDERRFDNRRGKLMSKQAGLAEAALMVEGWSEDPHALPPDWSGGALRRRLLDSQHILDRVAASAVALAGKDPTLVARAREAADMVGQRDDVGARAAAKDLLDMAGRAESIDGDGWTPARHFGLAVLGFLDLAEQALSPTDGADDEFEPTTMLAMGNLPGSGAAFKDVPARGTRWNPLARLDMVTRQAIQVTIAGFLAIYFGRLLSDTRYYWAIIAAFVAFTGTATRAETFTKAFNRVLGTVAGLFASIWIANLTAGNVGLVIFVILASMFCGFYLIRVSYAYMIFFITIMVGQMYSVLHEFSDGLLVLRLEETAIGAAAGILVSLVVVPLSATDAVRAARDAMFADLRDLLRGAAHYMSPETGQREVAIGVTASGVSAESGSPMHPVPTEIALAAPAPVAPVGGRTGRRQAAHRDSTRGDSLWQRILGRGGKDAGSRDDPESGQEKPDSEEEPDDAVPSTLAELDAKARALDDRFRQIVLAAKPRIRPLVTGSRSLDTRRRLDLYNALAIRSRALVVGIRSHPVEHSEYAATACLVLAEVADRLMTTRPGQPMPELGKPLEDADTAILQSLPSAPGDFRGDTNVLRPLAHLHDLLGDIAVTPRNS